MKKYWFVLHQDTFLWVKGDEGLVYGTSNKHLCYRFQNKGRIVRMTNDLLQPNNLYRTIVTEEDLSVNEVKEWVNTILLTSCGELIDIDDNIKVPVSLKPILKIQDTVSFYKVSHETHTDGKIIQNLLKLVIHLNGSIHGDDDIAKQIIFPQKTTNKLKEWTSIRNFITSMGNPNFLVEIILVGNIWKYPDYMDLLQFLHTLPVRVSVYVTEEDYRMQDYGTTSFENIFFYILKRNYNIPCVEKHNLFYHLIISSVNEYGRALDITGGLKPGHYKIMPVYTGDNKDFFEEFVYVTEEEIGEIQLSKREVFARQAINIYDFGTLTVDIDGHVYGNLNRRVLGTIDDGLYLLTYRELTGGDSWLSVRNESPCCNCIYQWICPSPSNYELVIGKPNLCHIKP